MADTKKPWIEGPYELIKPSKTGATAGTKQTGAEAVATEMVLIHNILIRGINAVHRQAINVATKGTDKDKKDFANYGYQWSVTVHSHHSMEETAIFPKIAEQTGVANIMDTNLEEHTAFEAGLNEYQAYLTEVKEGRVELDGEKLIKLIDNVMPILHKHLVNEVDTLLSLKQYDDRCDLEKIFRDEVGKALNMAMKDSGYRNNLLPLLFNSHDKSYENGVWMDFPPMPWVAMLAIRWLFCRTHADWWRFAPCDSTCYPQELPFA
ncbi:hypothetical protein NLU13_5889 [Sarocladium strictum]|uniref:Hemerythrin-like domain-containing protein n=1 Tax=Sarocladium strictum TaxID=5046 RepID=A0AA39GH92_SARSR|nr:hypothetical protein NLU13_5889 [Sarocladium strictum]